MSRKPIQISSSVGGIDALCNDGTIWFLSHSCRGWKQLPPIPEFDERSLFQIDDLDIPLRLKNALKVEGMQASDLRQDFLDLPYPEFKKKLLKITGIGQKGAQEIYDALSQKYSMK